VITWAEGDLFTCGISAIAHGVNCRGVMGAGIAVQFRRRYPDMYESYSKRCGKGHMWPGDILTWQHPGGIVFCLATQKEPGAHAEPWMITAAAGQMIAEAHYIRKITEIALPEIGCGIGGLTRGDLLTALAPYRNAPVNLRIVMLPGRTRT